MTVKYFLHQIVGLSKDVIIHPEVQFSKRKNSWNFLSYIPLLYKREAWYIKKILPLRPDILMIKDDTGRLLDKKFKIGGGNLYNKSLWFSVAKVTLQLQMSVCPSVCYQNSSASQNPIMPISHHDLSCAYQPSDLILQLLSLSACKCFKLVKTDSKWSYSRNIAVMSDH